MTITVTKELYHFHELDDAAKERARDWWRQGGLDYEWFDFVFEDAREVGRILGIDIKHIYFSGFASQGDGACFTGSYSYAKGCAKRLRQYAPLDETLHQIAADLMAVQRRAFYQLSAVVEHRGHYNHSGCTEIRVDDARHWNPSEDDDDGIQEALRDFMHWIYRQLEAAYEYLNSDEAVDETIEANEYTFDQYGHRED